MSVRRGDRSHRRATWASGLLTLLALAACGSADTRASARLLPWSPASAAASPSSSPVRKVAPSPTPVHRPAPSRSPVAVPAGRYAFPVTPASATSFGHSHHDYPATDIFAPCGATFRAPTSGRILGASHVDAWIPSVNAGATRGGLSVTLLGDDGVRYYGSHLRSVAIGAGARVVAGQALGQVGNTGSARGIACHVHFGISPLCGGTTDWYNRRGLVYPWPYLESWRSGGRLSPVAAVAAYQARHGCPSGPTVDP